MKEQELFEVWWNMAKHTLKCEYYDAFEIWQASANREGYKLVPVEMSWDKEGECFRLHQEFGYKKCMDCGVSLANWQPDWSQSPSGFDWWAKDGFSNKAHWYNKEPFLDDGVDGEDESQSAWDFILESKYTYTEASSFNYQGDWKDSLRKRP